MEHTVTHSNKTMQFGTLKHRETHCNTLQHTFVAVCCSVLQRCSTVHCVAVGCSALHRETQSNTLQHTATHCSTLQYTATNKTLQHTTTKGNTLQRTATNDNTL